MGSFVFKWPHPDAKDVHVTGTFDDWGKSEQLNKVGEFWEKEVNLSNADEKIYYKFVVDDNWVIDPTAPQEDDGHYNINNVLLPKDIKKHAASSAAAAATTTTDKAVQHKTPGDFPEDSTNEQEQAFGVAPIPASSGIGNPVSLKPGEKVPEPSTVTEHTVDSTATTSKEGYERDASAALPAAAGILGAGGLAAMVGSAFSKPEGKENLIPESSLPMGGDVKETMDAGPHISSAAPQSSSAALAAGVPLENKRQAMVIDPADAPQTTVETAAGVPEPVKESLSKAHQSPEAAVSAEAVKEKSAMEQELLKKTTTSDATGDSGVTPAAQTSYYGLATEVPGTVEKSMQEAHAPPEAAADSSVVAEKSAMESELLKKVPSSEEAGEPAPTIAAATSGSAPSATKDTTADASGLSTGEKIAGGAVGGMGAAGVVGVLASSNDKSEAPKSEPVSENAPVGSQEAPAPTTDSLSKDEKVAAGAAGGTATAGTLGSKSSAPAAVADGTDATEVPAPTQPSVPFEKTEGDAAEYAPVPATKTAPGVSSSAAAAVSDGTEDPTLANEPAVKMMQQQDHSANTAPSSTGNEMSAPQASAYDTVTSEATPSSTAAATSTPPVTTSTKDGKLLGGVVAGTSTKPTGTTTSPSAGSTSVKKTATIPADTSSPASSANTKKRNRLSRIYHKIVD